MASPWSRRALLGSLLLSGCGRALRNFPFEPTGPSTLDDPDALMLRFYSVACTRISWGGIDLLTDPFFTHVPFRQVAFGATEPDTDATAPYRDELGLVRAVVIGHSHYDHLLDLPPICDDLAPDAQIFGSRTSVHTLAPFELPRPMVPVNDDCATPDHPGRRHTAAEGRLRILPIASGHPANYPGIHVWQDRLTEDRESIPHRASDYQEGDTLAFLVDFLEPDAETIGKRVYVQTTSRGYPDGFFPPSVLDEHPVDLALLPMDCAVIAANGRQPSVIDFLSPKAVVFCHWENFFRPKGGVPREAVKIDLRRLRKKLSERATIPMVFPYWDSTHWFGD